MAKYRKKPVVIDAFLLGVDYMPDWFAEAVANGVVYSKEYYECLNKEHLWYIRTLEGVMVAHEELDYIIKGVEGELYPCKADIFEKTYEAVRQ